MLFFSGNSSWERPLSGLAFLTVDTVPELNMKVGWSNCPHRICGAGGCSKRRLNLLVDCFTTFFFFEEGSGASGLSTI